MADPVAVLFLVFNRPDTTAQVFEAIRRARPPRLYVAADGPRPQRDGEAARCAEVRRIATAVDWPCELHTLLRDRNLGCKQAVSQAISWFFEHETEGIVLEDDVLPQPSLFGYCAELLERYRDEPRVATVCGSNLVSHLHRPADSYFFARQPHIWGWATWRRAWQDHDAAMAGWPQWDASGGLLRWLGGDRCAADYWRRIFDRMHRGEVDTWDYQWVFSCWYHGRLAVLPATNLSSNIGFGPDATHTVKDAPDAVRRSAPRDLEGPLRHPARIELDEPAQRLIRREVLGLTHARCLRFALKRLFRRPPR